MTTGALLLRGMLFGIGAAAPIGPVNVEIARRSLRHSFFAAFALGCGAVTIDVTYAVVSALGVTPLLDIAQGRNSWFYWAMTIAAVGFLAYLGVMSLRGARAVARSDVLEGFNRGAPRSDLRARRNSYITGLLMTGLSPMTLAFWFIVLPKWAGEITTRSAQSPRDLPIIVVGVFVATITWVIVFAGMLSFAGRWRRRWWLVAADEFGGAMLLVLAAGALLRSVQRFL